MGGFMRSTMERRSGLSTLSNPSSELIDALTGGSTTAAGKTVNGSTALNIGAVYSAVRILSEAVRICPMEVERPAENGRFQSALDSRMQTLVGVAPNPEMPASEMWETIVGHLAIHGNAFLFKERDLSGRVIRLWPLQPHQVLVGRYNRQKVYALYPWTEVGLPPYDLPEIGTDADIIHFRWFGTNGLVGLPPIRQLREEVAVEARQVDFSGEILKNNARPGGILTTEGKLSEGAATRLLQRWIKAQAEAGKVAVLEEGLKWQQTTLSLVDAQFIAQRQLSLTAIARGWRIPASMFLAEAGSSMTYSTTEQEGRNFLAYTLQPILDRLTAVMSADPDLQIEPGLRFTHNTDAILNVETLARLQGLALQINAGMISRNEARLEEGRKTVDGLDTYVDPHTQARLTGDLSLPAIQAALAKTTGGGVTP